MAGQRPNERRSNDAGKMENLAFHRNLSQKRPDGGKQSIKSELSLRLCTSGRRHSEWRPKERWRRCSANDDFSEDGVVAGGEAPKLEGAFRSGMNSIGYV